MVKKKGAFPAWIGKRKRRFRITGIVFLSLLLSFIVATYYVQTRRNKIAAIVLEIINENYSGHIAYDKIILDDWIDLSTPSINFENLVVTDTSSANQLRLRAEELNLELSIKDLLQGMIQIKSATLAGGELSLDNYTPLTPEEQKGLPPLRDSLKLSDNVIDPFLEKNTRLDISDLHVKISHHVKNKRIEIQVNEISSEIEFTDESIRAYTSLDVDIEALGFNLDKGSFANGAEARGTLESVFDRSRKQLDIASFPLELSDQVFNTSATLNFMDVGTFDILLENHKTKYSSTMALLTENIREKFASITLEGPLYTRTKLEGSFFYKNNPRIQVDFQSEDNTAVFEGEKRLADLNFSGQFANRVYTDERADTEDPKDFRIQVYELTGRFKDITFQVEEMELATSPDAENVFGARINASGSPESLNNFVNDQHWSFQGGQLEFTSRIKGENLDMGSILATGHTRFSLQDTRIINNENGVGLPVTGVSLMIKNDKATLEELKIKVSPRDNLVVRAGFTNFSSLFGDKPNSALQSEFRIESENLIWEDFIGLFHITSSNKKTERPQLVLRDLLRDLHQKYNPQIHVELGQFHFGQSVLTGLRSGLHFENPDLLILDETSFGIGEGKMALKGELDLAHKDRVPLEMSLEGNAGVNVLNQLLTGDQLTLSGGQFRFSATLSGDMLRPEEVLSQSESLIQMSDFDVTYAPAEITFPVKSLELELKKDQAKLKDLTLHFGEQNEVTFSGDIQNLSTLLFGGFRKEVYSELNIESEKLIWEDYVEIFGASDSLKSKSTHGDPEELLAAERKFKDILRDVHTALNPRLTVDIKEFRYRDMKGFHDFRTGISFKDGQTLKLEEMSFLYDRETAINLLAEIDIADSAKTYIAAQLQASGDPEELNEILNNDTFFFRGGSFQVNAEIRGDIEALDSLIAHSNSELRVKDTFIEYKPGKVNLPVAALDVDLSNNTAKLNALEVELESGDRIVLSGVVGYISDLIFDLPSEESRAYSSVRLQADKVTFDEFRSLFAIRTEDSSKERHKTALRPAVRDIYNKFRPSLTVSIDEFELNGLEVHNLKTGFYFEDENRIYLEKSEFDFHDGSVSLDAHLDISEAEKTFFSFGFITDEIALDRLLQAFDYFDLPSLQSATTISGLISLDTEVEGEVSNEGLIIPESLKGTINFDLEEARVSGFEPLIESAGKIFKKERLEDIRFMPIKNSMTLSDKLLDIPLMEIQSSAFELFVAGQLGFGDALTNLWIGFPLNNLKSRDVRNVPDKKGYIASGKKVYVEAKSDEKKGMKYILHLTPKKFYQERDMKGNYRSDIREERLQIRQYKRKDSSKANR